jgi:hypothetical protein
MWVAAGVLFVTLGGVRLDDDNRIDLIEGAIPYRVVGRGRPFTFNLDSSMAISRGGALLQTEPVQGTVA